MKIRNKEDYTIIITEELGELSVAKNRLMFQHGGDTLSILTTEAKPIATSLYTDITYPLGSAEQKLANIVKKHYSNQADAPDGVAIVVSMQIVENIIELSIIGTIGEYVNVSILVDGYPSPIYLGWINSIAYKYNIGEDGTGAMLALNNNCIITLPVSPDENGSEIIAETTIICNSGGQLIIPLPPNDAVTISDSRFLPNGDPDYIVLIDNGNTGAYVDSEGYIVIPATDFEDEEKILFAYLRNNGNVVATLSYILVNPPE